MTNTDYRTKDNTVHTAALKGKGGLAVTQHPNWSHELSGRLVSHVVDLASDNSARFDAWKASKLARGETVPSKLQYIGVAIATALELRNISSLSSDVIYTPTAEDQAHSDVVIEAGDDLDAKRIRVCQTLRFVDRDAVGAAIETCGAIAASPHLMGTAPIPS